MLLFSKLPRFSFSQYVLLVVVMLGLCITPATRSNLLPEAEQQQIALLKLTDTPVQVAAEDDFEAFIATLSAQSIYVSDEASGTILLAKNQNQQLYPASTTKLMTALVAREVFYLSQVLTVGQGALVDGNVVGLLPGEQISVQQLLPGLLIRSGNDVATVLANNHPQGYQGFIDAMNQKAATLHLKQTVFSNPSGLDASEQAMSAHDLAILSREVFKDSILLEIMGQTTAQSEDSSGLLIHQLGNTHQLLYTDQTVVAGKTGTTEGAGQVLVTLFERPDQNKVLRKVIVVVMGSQDRYQDTKQIIDWVFTNYEWQKFDTIDRQGI